jgi:hypothetical protein
LLEKWNRLEIIKVPVACDSGAMDKFVNTIKASRIGAMASNVLSFDSFLSDAEQDLKRSVKREVRNLNEPSTARELALVTHPRRCFHAFDGSLPHVLVSGNAVLLLLLLLLLRDAVVVGWTAFRSIGFQQHTNFFGLLQPVEETVERRFCGDQCLDPCAKMRLRHSDATLSTCMVLSCGAIDNHRKLPFLSVCNCMHNKRHP